MTLDNLVLRKVVVELHRGKLLFDDKQRPTSRLWRVDRNSMLDPEFAMLAHTQVRDTLEIDLVAMYMRDRGTIDPEADKSIFRSWIPMLDNTKECILPSYEIQQEHAVLGLPVYRRRLFMAYWHVFLSFFVLGE